MSSSSPGSSITDVRCSTTRPRRSSFRTIRSRCPRRARRAGKARPAHPFRLPVRPRLQRLRNRLGAIRNHVPEIMYKAFAIAGYDKSVVDERFARMINALQVWRAAPRRDRPRHDPDRHASFRRDEHPGGHRLPHGPEWPRPADEPRRPRSRRSSCGRST